MIMKAEQNAPLFSVLFRDKVYFFSKRHTMNKWLQGGGDMGLRKDMTEALELPKEIMLNLPLISLVGREEVTIENYKGILEYGEEVVRISTAAGILRLQGQGLCLKQLSAECMVVTGKVESIQFLT